MDIISLQEQIAARCGHFNGVQHEGFCARYDDLAMLNASHRRALEGMRRQIDAAMDLLERTQRAHLATAPVHMQIPIDNAFLFALEGYVIGPIRETLHRLSASGLSDERLENAGANLGGNTGTGAVMKYLVALGCLGATVDGLLHDEEAPVEAAVEVAFTHLQRSIVVDEDLRKRWQTAFDGGEVACEKLGGVHLLQHGLWGFKTDAAGERSDLVLGQHGSAIDQRSLQGARGLILTEWKKIGVGDSPSSIESKVSSARKQLSAYTAGSLAGVELRRVRYVVLVSQTQQPARPDLVADTHATRFVNIAVDPQTPSKL